MSLSLHRIAQGVGGRVSGNKVVAPGPEAASKKGYKRRKNTLTVWINDDGDIGVNGWRRQDPIVMKDWIRAQCGLPAWAPKKRKSKPLPSLWERNQFLAESLKIARNRTRITLEQFALLLNDLKNACPEAILKSRAVLYAREFGFTPSETDAALRLKWRSYTAAERAAVFQITYDEYRRLGLRRSGCFEIDPAERRRLTKQRYNAKRRAARAVERVSKSAACRAPLCPSYKVGTVRVPSSEAVVGLVGSGCRDPESRLIEVGTLRGGKIDARRRAASDEQHGLRFTRARHVRNHRTRLGGSCASTFRARTSKGETMSEEMSVEEWLAIRKEEGLKIDPSTAEVDWSYAQVLDPYGIYPELPEECDQVGRAYFARRPGSDIWVEFGDLPEKTRETLWARYKGQLAFPAGLNERQLRPEKDSAFIYRTRG